MSSIAQRRFASWNAVAMIASRLPLIPLPNVMLETFAGFE
jgi:hypothetical protein